jgi:hypothetical protein
MDSDDKASGGCTCGAVRYETTGNPLDIAYCHCSDCRGFSGSPVVTWVVFDSDKVQYLKAKPKTYESSPGLHWGFCEHCGASMTWAAISKRFPGKHITEILVGSFDNPEKLIPDQHWYDSERLPWFDVSDNLPRYKKEDLDNAKPTHSGPVERL